MNDQEVLEFGTGEWIAVDDARFPHNLRDDISASSAGGWDAYVTRSGGQVFWCYRCRGVFDRVIYHCPNCDHHNLPEYTDGCKYCYHDYEELEDYARARAKIEGPFEPRSWPMLYTPDGRAYEMRPEGYVEVHRERSDV